MGTTTVRERPITMSGWMVRAVMEDRKTQTRRVVKWDQREKGLNLSSSSLSAGHYFTDHPELGWVLYSRRGDGVWEQRTNATHCSFGQPGDHLWVKETWAIEDESKLKLTKWEGGQNPDWIYYRDAIHEGTGLRWRSPILMPRWASRLTLEIIEVRVQRVQEISEADALADGGWTYLTCPIHKCPERSFAELWDVMHSKRPGYSWEANPFVWCLSFRRID